MALFRALETAKGSRRRLFDDPFASAFLPSPLQRIVHLSRLRFIGGALERFIDWRWPGARSSGVSRTRLVDDWLGDAIESGAEQVVILGAGFDARAQRLPNLSSIDIFELDRASVLDRKKAVLASHRRPGSNVAYLSVDFLRDDIAQKLISAGYDRRAKTVFLWEGVTNYLNCDAVCNVFNLVAHNAAPGSSVIFTYIHRDVLDGRFEAIGLTRLMRQLKNWDEPWTFGFHPERLPKFLAKRGYDLTEDTGASQYRQRYLGDQAIKLNGYEFYRVACAHLSKVTVTKEQVFHAAR